MSLNRRLAGEDDPEVAQALKNFKASVDAWCESAEAARSRPRTIKVVRRSWRMAAGWALGCAVAATGLSGGLYERQHRQELSRIAAANAAAQKAAQQKLAAEQQAANQTDQDLLANVDSDISRAVPAAMEPLAQLMDDKQANKNGTQQ
ncbi:MAG: hypothetical protein WBA18_14400 [Terracidiphilus sp.]